ncbi:MAG: TolA-binding protein [Candidatus Krumholzibacteriia bacterium]|jgi:TolA-binding protein
MRTWQRKITVATALPVLLCTSLFAAEQPPSTLAEYGLAFEAAELEAVVGDETERQSLNRALAMENQNRIAEGRKDVLEMLWGSLHFASGDYEQASKSFGKAAGQTDDTALRSAAAYRQTESQVAALQGLDNEKAGEHWQQWLQRYGDSSLKSEAELRLIWIKLREGDTAEALVALTKLGERDTWLLKTPNFNFTRAAAEFLSGNYAACQSLLTELATDPQSLYLAGLCHEALEQPLQATSYFQRVVTEFPHSELNDDALFAKANTFLNSQAYRSAAEDFAQLAKITADPIVRAEAELRSAAAIYLDGDFDLAANELRQVVIIHAGTDVAARAQFILGEVMMSAADYPAAIVEYTEVLSSYFDKSIAASAQYRLGRCYDAMNQPNDATASYMAVVSGYPMEPEAPAAAYLAGTSLLKAGNPRAAAPYFQIVLDRYGRNEDSDGTIVFASESHQELVEASLCMLEVSWHQVGDMGQLTGAPHAMLLKSPPSQSFWRGWTVLIDADALASQGNFGKARESLEMLRDEFPDHPAVTPANQLLAWTYAQQGEEELAIATSEAMLARYTGQGDLQPFSEALLNVAHVRFNQNRYQDAVDSYEEFLSRYPDHDQRLIGLYQAGLCYLRLDRGGDAIDRWEAIVLVDPGAEIAEKAWARTGDLYFQAEKYEAAKQNYEGLLANFSGTPAASLGQLRIAQCDFNAGDDAASVAGYEELISRYPDTPLKEEADRGIELALYRMGQQEGGIAELTQLITEYPNSSFAPDAQFQIATRLYEKEDFIAAADEYRRVVSKFPGYSAADRAQFLMAESYERAESGKRARLAYEQFLGFFAESDLKSSAQFRLGMSHFGEGTYDAAAVQFSDVLAGDPEQDVAKASLFNLGLCRRLQGQLAPATVHFMDYQKRFPADERAADVAFQLGDVYDQSGRVSEAIAAFRAAARAKPEPTLRAEIYFRMGGSFEKKDNSKKALEAYRLASRGGRSDDPFRLSSVARSAVLYEDSEQYELALAAYRDLMNNAGDAELVAAAKGRAAEIAAALN